MSEFVEKYVNPDAEWTKHSSGKMNTLGDQFVSRKVDLSDI